MCLVRPATRRLLNEVLNNEAAWLSQQGPFQALSHSALQTLLQQKSVEKLVTGQSLAVDRDLVMVREGDISSSASGGLMLLKH